MSSQMLAYRLFLYTLHYYVIEYRCLKNVIQQIDSKNQWLFLSASFRTKSGLVLVLTVKNAFSQTLHFEANRKSTGSSKNGNRNFLNSPPFERLACFYEIISRNFERFQYFNFKTDFLENENLFKKLEYRFSVESTKIEIASFLYKTTVSEANTMINSMVNTKWTYHIELSTLFYRKFCFSIRTFQKELR